MAGPRNVLLVGSVPFANATEVLRNAVGIVGPCLKRVPDGETGDRLEWVMWFRPRLAANPHLIIDPQEAAEGRRIIPQQERHREHRGAAQPPRLRPAPGLPAGSIKLGPLGYAEEAQASYRIFAQLKRDGVIAAATRFQISLPTPAACLNAHFLPDDQGAMEPAFEAALRDEVDSIAATLPHDQIAVQWDVSTELAVWLGVRPNWFEPIRPGVFERLVTVCGMVPRDIELGLHLCHGDYGHKHWAEPPNTSHLVEIANGIAQRTPRPIAWIHMPVPRDRDDDDYFAPLEGLRLDGETELYLGLVHHSDGIAGSLRRMQVAARHRKEFGLSTECGLGRREPATILELLRMHAELADMAA